MKLSAAIALLFIAVAAAAQDACPALSNFANSTCNKESKRTIKINLEIKNIYVCNCIRFTTDLKHKTCKIQQFCFTQKG